MSSVPLCPECGVPPWVEHRCGARVMVSESAPVPTGDALIAHFKICDCHDSWDQCPCADGGHPADRSCGCCPFGIGLCGSWPAR